MSTVDPGGRHKLNVNAMTERRKVWGCGQMCFVKFLLLQGVEMTSITHFILHSFILQLRATQNNVGDIYSKVPPQGLTFWLHSKDWHKGLEEPEKNPYRDFSICWWL